MKPARSRWKDTSESDDSDEDSEESSAKPVRKPPAKKPTSLKPEKNGSSNESFRDGSLNHKRLVTSRRGKTVSCKEASEDEQTGSKDLIDIDVNEESRPLTFDGNTETIERIVSERIGKKGVTGNETTVYAVEEKCDPNLGVDIYNKSTTKEQI